MARHGSVLSSPEKLSLEASPQGSHQPHTSEPRSAGSLRAPGAAFVPAAGGKWKGICSFSPSEGAALHIGVVLHELGCILGGCMLNRYHPACELGCSLGACIALYACTCLDVGEQRIFRGQGGCAVHSTYLHYNQNQFCGSSTSFKGPEGIPQLGQLLVHLQYPRFSFCNL